MDFVCYVSNTYSYKLPYHAQKQNLKHARDDRERIIQLILQNKCPPLCNNTGHVVQQMFIAVEGNAILRLYRRWNSDRKIYLRDKNQIYFKCYRVAL